MFSSIPWATDLPYLTSFILDYAGFGDNEMFSDIIESLLKSALQYLGLDNCIGVLESFRIWFESDLNYIVTKPQNSITW